MRGWCDGLTLEEGGCAVDAHWLMFVVESAGARKMMKKKEVLTWPLSPRHCSKTPGA